MNRLQRYSLNMKNHY